MAVYTQRTHPTHTPLARLPCLCYYEQRVSVNLTGEDAKGTIVEVSALDPADDCVDSSSVLFLLNTTSMAIDNVYGWLLLQVNHSSMGVCLGCTTLLLWFYIMSQYPLPLRTSLMFAPTLTLFQTIFINLRLWRTSALSDCLQTVTLSI